MKKLEKIRELEKKFDQVVDQMARSKEDTPQWLLLAIKKGQILAQLSGVRAEFDDYTHNDCEDYAEPDGGLLYCSVCGKKLS